MGGKGGGIVHAVAHNLTVSLLCVADFGVEIESSKLAVDGLEFYCFLKQNIKGVFTSNRE